jgi:hypothetical protein
LSLCFGVGLGLSACQTDSHSATCDLQQQVAQAGSPLTLLPGARLDKVADGFMLMGQQGGVLRWAPVTAGGQVGAEQSADIPASVAGPWFAAGGKDFPGDTILIVYGTPSSAAGLVDLQAVAVPSSGVGVGALVSAGVVATVTDPSALDGAAVAMGTGRLGRRAALAWFIPGQNQVHVQSLGGDARAVGAAAVEPVDSKTPLVECLSFVVGKGDLAVGFTTKASTDDPEPSWEILEIADDGAAGPSVTLGLGTAHPTCPLSAASGTGYVTAWQNEIGSLIGFYDGTGRTFDSHIFAAAVTFGGANGQPPLAGVAPVAGGDYAVVLARPGAAEAWRVTAGGVVATGNVVFPSAVGKMGDISTVSVSGSLYATYADYSSSTTVGTDGQRFFIKISCF